ncbi:amidohydrolase family protein [Hyaloscypha variabilis]
MSNKIDVHHHFYPEVFNQALQKAGGDPSGWFVPEWTLSADQELSKSIGVQTAILSMTAPGACIEREPKAAATLARQSNEAAASIRDQHPTSYGFFASLPNLLDTKETLEELAYGVDTLKADGVILFTRYKNDNHYLGHPDFRPIWQELNRRKAVVFIHPTHPVDTHLVNNHLPQPMFDYPHETGRTAIDMLLSDTLSLTPDCKIILSHAGGTLPYLIDRVAGMLPYTPFSVNKTTTQILEEAKRFYFDTALSSNPGVLDLLLRFAAKGHVLFGSDFPNAPN